MCIRMIWPNIWPTFQKSAKTLTPIDHQFRYLGDDDQIRWFHLTATPEKMDDGGILWHGHLNDITAQKQNEQKFEHMAYNDALPVCPNGLFLKTN